MKAEDAFQRALALSKAYTKKSLEGAGAVKGKDGFSPVVEKRETEDGAEISITDATHTETLEFKEVAFTGKYGDLKEIPKYAPAKSGFYKIEVDESGNVSSVAPVTKEDIIGLGVDTGYVFAVGDNGHLYVKPKDGQVN